MFLVLSNITTAVLLVYQNSHIAMLLVKLYAFDAIEHHIEHSWHLTWHNKLTQWITSLVWPHVRKGLVTLALQAVVLM